MISAPRASSQAVSGNRNGSLGAYVHAFHAVITEIQPHRRYSPRLRINRILRNTKSLMTQEDGRLACSETLAAVSRVNSDTIAALRIVDCDLGLTQRRPLPFSTGPSTRELLLSGQAEECQSCTHGGRDRIQSTSWNPRAPVSVMDYTLVRQTDTWGRIACILGIYPDSSESRTLLCRLI